MRSVHHQVECLIAQQRLVYLLLSPRARTALVLGTGRVHRAVLAIFSGGQLVTDAVSRGTIRPRPSPQQLLLTLFLTQLMGTPPFHPRSHMAWLITMRTMLRIIIIITTTPLVTMAVAVMVDDILHAVAAMVVVVAVEARAVA